MHSLLDQVRPGPPLQAHSLVAQLLDVNPDLEALSFMAQPRMACREPQTSSRDPRGRQSTRSKAWAWKSFTSSRASAALTASSRFGSPGEGREKLGAKSSARFGLGFWGRRPSTGLSTSATRARLRAAVPRSASWK